MLRRSFKNTWIASFLGDEDVDDIFCFWSKRFPRGEASRRPPWGRIPCSPKNSLNMLLLQIVNPSYDSGSDIYAPLTNSVPLVGTHWRRILLSVWLIWRGCRCFSQHYFHFCSQESTTFYCLKWFVVSESVPPSFPLSVFPFALK